MNYSNFVSGKNLLVRAECDSDLIQFITKIAEKKEILTGYFIAIGALKSSKLGFYDQKKHQYIEETLDFPQELLSCIGSISIKAGRPFVHAHVVVSGVDGNAKGGHLLAAMVFAVEIYLKKLNSKLERKYDEITGLFLWDNNLT